MLVYHRKSGVVCTRRGALIALVLSLGVGPFVPSSAAETEKEKTTAETVRREESVRRCVVCVLHDGSTARLRLAEVRRGTRKRLLPHA